MGLGGVGAPLEQVGTTAECVNGGVRYRAFYENISGLSGQDPDAVFLTPENGYEGYPVTPNDRIEARVEANRQGQFRFTIYDSAWKRPFTTPWLPGSKDAAAVSSAEWIAEAPRGLEPQCRLSQCALTHVVTDAQTGDAFPGVTFSGCSANGQAISIGPSITRFSLTVTPGPRAAVTSTVAPDDTAFSVKWESQ